MPSSVPPVACKNIAVCGTIETVLDDWKAHDSKQNAFFCAELIKLDENQTAEIVITMLTSSLNHDDKERALAIKEVSEYINKPLTQEVVIEIIERYFVNKNATAYNE